MRGRTPFGVAATGMIHGLVPSSGDMARARGSSRVFPHRVQPGVRAPSRRPCGQGGPTSGIGDRRTTAHDRQDGRYPGADHRRRNHGRLARLSPHRPRVARRRTPGAARADRGLDMARGRALHPLRAPPDDHGDACGLGASVPGRAAGRDRGDDRLSSMRGAACHPFGRADGRVPSRAGARAVRRARAPHSRPRGAGPHLSTGAHRRAARGNPRAGRWARRPDARHPGAGGRSAVAGRRGPAPRAGAGSRTRRIGGVGRPYRP